MIILIFIKIQYSVEYVTTNIFRYPRLDAINQFPLVPFFNEYFSIAAENISGNSLSFNVLLCGDFSGAITSIVDINDQYKLHKQYSSGNLFTYELPECTYFMFVPNQCNFSSKLKSLIENEIPITGYVWLSYLKNTEFRWHKDRIETRLHYPLSINSNSHSLQIDGFSACRFSENKCYVFNPQQKHRVPLQAGERLHLVATCGKIDFETLTMAK